MSTGPHPNPPFSPAMPLRAEEWACHAKTTIKDADGFVVAECSGHGRYADHDEALAALIVKRVNAYPRLVDALKRNATCSDDGGEIGEAWALLRELGEA